MMAWVPAQIFFCFFRISLLSFGGIFGVLPELERDMVHAHHWITHDQFIQAYVTAQFVPGPNMVMCPLLGYQIGGWSGMVAGFLGIYLAPVFLMGAAYAIYRRYREVEKVRRLELALRPLVLGMLGASALRLWWEQSRLVAPDLALSYGISLTLTIVGILLLRRKMVGPLQLLLIFGCIAWSASRFI
jgi:chromate transport protein ChrA